MSFHEILNGFLSEIGFRYGHFCTLKRRISNSLGRLIAFKVNSNSAVFDCRAISLVWYAYGFARLFNPATTFSPHWRALCFNGSFADEGLIFFFGEPIKNFIDKYFNLLTIVFFALIVLGFVVIKYLV